MTQPMLRDAYGDSPAVNYERYFVPTIGMPLAQDLVERAELQRGEQVLDVACGTGVVTRLAAERVGHAAVTGVDLHPGMLEVARTADGGPVIEWHEASAEALPLEDASFDVVLCQMGLQFFDDRPGALREMRRVLRPGGRAVVSVPGPTPRLFDVLERALERHVGSRAAGFVATVFSLHDVEELYGLLEGAGFTDVQARAEPVTLSPPPAEQFLWQYVSSTPLASAASALDEDTRAALQQEVVGGWSSLAGDGRLVLEIDLTTVTARKP
ncbi:MAG: methyltransferase domain-containing protein [Gaiella sp.]|nr:methyltransferase domain-containing protein [Gaiella sp.]